MQNHPQCVVDTYKNWITDSVYSTKCGLCEVELVKSETDIVHWDCLDAWARSLPATTAPAGYTCPICKRMGLFPVLNQVSPIADALRSKMGEVNWARAGLGLPLLDNEVRYSKNNLTFNGVSDGHQNHNQSFQDNEFDRKSDVSDATNNSMNNSMSNFHRHSNAAEVHSHSHSHSNHQDSQFTKLHESYGGTGGNSYYGHGDVGGLPTESFSQNTSSRKTTRADFETPLLIDDDDKYRRRSPFESLSRWLRNVSTGKRRMTRRRTAVYAIFGIIATVILLMVIFGRSSDDDDEDGLNPHANPNLLIGNGKGALIREHDSESDT
jgi:hypothetical protein